VVDALVASTVKNVHVSAGVNEGGWGRRTITTDGLPKTVLGSVVSDLTLDEDLTIHSARIDLEETVVVNDDGRSRRHLSAKGLPLGPGDAVGFMSGSSLLLVPDSTVGLADEDLKQVDGVQGSRDAGVRGKKTAKAIELRPSDGSGVSSNLLLLEESLVDTTNEDVDHGLGSENGAGSGGEDTSKVGPSSPVDSGGIVNLMVVHQRAGNLSAGEDTDVTLRVQENGGTSGEGSAERNPVLLEATTSILLPVVVELVISSDGKNLNTAIDVANSLSTA